MPPSSFLLVGGCEVPSVGLSLGLHCLDHLPHNMLGVPAVQDNGCYSSQAHTQVFTLKSSLFLAVFSDDHRERLTQVKCTVISITSHNSPASIIVSMQTMHLHLFVQ